MINSKLHKLPGHVLKHFDSLDVDVLSAITDFEYAFNPSCGQDFKSNVQVWHFEGAANKMQELNINFEQLNVLLEADSEVFLYLKFSNVNQLQSFKMNAVVLDGARLEVRVLIDFAGDENFDLSLINHCLESGANADVRIVYDLSGNSKLNLLSELRFLQAQNTGQILINGIMDDKSMSEVDGKIFISENANKTDSNLEQKVLLLSDKCRNVITPALEILTDDVKAAHGVSVSQVPEEVLFYFASRGLSLESAKILYKESVRNALF